MAAPPCRSSRHSPTFLRHSSVFRMLTLMTTAGNIAVAPSGSHRRLSTPLVSTRCQIPDSKPGGETERPLKAFSDFVVRQKPNGPRKRIIIVPSNKDDSSLWYRNLGSHLRTEVQLMEDFPNPYHTMTKRWERIWIDAMREFQPDENTVLIGHMSGAEAVLRFIEDHRVAGVILVATPGDEYYAGERHGRLYRWESIRGNTDFIVQFHSVDDPLGKIEEARNVAANANAELIVLKDRGTFLQGTFPELMDFLKSKLEQD
eukprot:jgi/Bigna1/89114/estExt_fgenesh1_pg.C_440021